MVRVAGSNPVLALKLGAAIDAEWIGRRVRPIRLRRLPVEDIIGGYMDDPRAGFACGNGQFARRGAVDAVCLVRLILGLVDRGVGRRR
jgi:hypothetical protein